MYCSEDRENKNILNPKTENLLDIAKEAIVLLKNDENILPLKKQGLKLLLLVIWQMKR